MRAFIIDLDGTLVDSLADLRTALNRALHARALRDVSREEVRRWIGNGVTELCRRAVSHQCALVDDALVDAIRTAMLHEYASCCLDQTAVYAGINETMTVIRERRFQCAVLSNKAENFTRRIVESLFPRDWFDVVRGATDDLPRKPSPVVALQIADQLSVAPSDVVFVGDSEVDIQTARNAGMISVAVTWGFRDVEALKSLEPDHLIDRPEALIDLLPRDA